MSIYINFDLSYFIITYININATRKIILATVKNRRYFPLDTFFFCAMNLYEIRLAIDAINVPKPPILVPTINAGKLSVKFDKSSAAGTLLTT